MGTYMSNEKIAIFTHLDENFKAVNSVVHKNHTEYALANNHEYIKLSTEQIIDHEPINKEIYWVKLLGVLQLLKSRNDIDWIFMMDLDIVFSQKNINLSFFTNCANEKQDMLMCSMGNNMAQNLWNVNIGAVFFRNTEYVKSWLTTITEEAKIHNFIALEQSILHRCLQYNYMGMLDKIGFFPEHAFNHGGSQHFLHHACGASTSNSEFNNAVQQKVKTLEQTIKEINA